jgi:hypothetical protein
MRLEQLESRQLLAATPLGVTPLDTGEFLLGKVAVTPVFFESDGRIDPETQNWTPEEIDQVLAKLSEGVHWWSETLDALDTVHSLEFVIDDSFAVDPFETSYEPIDRSSTTFDLYVGEFVTAMGYGDANSIESAVQRFNHDQRLRLGTDWSFTVFVVDSSDDADGLFASGGAFAAAFAFAGGLFYLTPSTRPASTFAHEMGHIFWARDEYADGGSWSDRRGYYDAPNLNAANNPAPGFKQEISIMRGGVPLTSAYEAHVSPASTLALLGWQDSDGDGIFDLADVPLRLDASGYFDADASVYHFRGQASAVPLMNRNSSGPQSDITLNRISHVQYSLDDGPWLTAASPDQQSVEFDLTIEIGEAFSLIRWRVIDASTGVVSPIVQGSPELPAMSVASLQGIAFLDQNANGQRELGESALPGTRIVVRSRDGSELLRGQVDPAVLPDGDLGDLTGVSLAADGVVSDRRVGVFASKDDGDQRVFYSFDQQRNQWIDRWSSRVALEASLDQPVGLVQVQAIGVSESSFARLEAYDASGQLLGRSTSGALGVGDAVTVEFSDPLGRIARIRAFGHAGTSVALSELRFGSEPALVTDVSGAWRLQNLPDGPYLVELVPERVIHRFAQSAIEVDVVAGSSAAVVAAAQRVDSPRYNTILAEDANQDGSVSSRDALVIINDMDRFGPRVLQASETSGMAVDVSNDGVVSALDALLVINRLGQQPSQSGEGLRDGATSPAVARSIAQTTSRADSGASAEGIRPMLNSAGSAGADKSSEGSSADTTQQPNIGRQPLARSFEAFRPAGSPTSHPTGGCDRPAPEEESGGNAERWSDLIPLKIAEPFGTGSI